MTTATKDYDNCPNPECLRIVRVVKIRFGGCTACGGKKRAKKAPKPLKVKVLPAPKPAKVKKVKPPAPVTLPSGTRICARCKAEKPVGQMQTMKSGGREVVTRNCQACYRAICTQGAYRRESSKAKTSWAAKKKIKGAACVCKRCRRPKRLDEMQVLRPGGVETVTSTCRECWSEHTTRVRALRTNYPSPRLRR